MSEDAERIENFAFYDANITSVTIHENSTLQIADDAFTSSRIKDIYYYGTEFPETVSIPAYCTVHVISGNGETLLYGTVDKIYSKVGYYADFEGDGTVDGIIYADLAKGGSGSYGNCTYSYDAVNDVKDYYISQKDFNGPFGTKDVLTPKKDDVRADRFFVMDLTDFNGGQRYYWYYDAVDDSNTYVVRMDFGQGKINTEKMLEKWEIDYYGTKNDSDMWGAVKEKNKDGWFIPTIGEWGACLDGLKRNAPLELGNIKGEYWSSFGLGRDGYCMSTNLGPQGRGSVNSVFKLRLSKTF